MHLQVDLDGAVVAECAGGDASSSDSDSEGDAEEMDVVGAPVKEQPPAGPVVDQEGFELVQRRRPRRGAAG